MDLVTFVHIPKTAGTSFRVGLEKYFGQQSVCRDYGPKAPETFDSVRKWIYAEKDFWKFAQIVSKEAYCCIAGHFSAGKYAPLFGIERAIAFLRDPFQRLLSEFNHFKRLHGYTENLQTFYQTPQFINRQLKAFKDVPWPLLGFIGTTEKYELSLRLLNAKYDMAIPMLKTNIGKSAGDDEYCPTPEDEEAIRRLNAAEILFYGQVCQFLQQRIDMAESGRPFVRGKMTAIKRHSVSGWAVFDDSDECVTVEVRHNDRVVGEVAASDFRPLLNQLGGRRGGFAGFSLAISGLKAGDEIACRVGQTGQPLVDSPQVVSDDLIKKG